MKGGSLSICTCLCKLCIYSSSFSLFLTVEITKGHEDQQKHFTSEVGESVAILLIELPPTLKTFFDKSHDK